MSVYIHIPFCRSKCFYCGFYSVASGGLQEAYVKSLCREMDLRKDYLSPGSVSTLYLGGGTPSYLTLAELEVIVNKAESVWTFPRGAERTIEMNPEDVTVEKLRGLKELGFNRLSIGIQSFNDNVLKKINRTHSAMDGIRAVERASAAGFDNIGIDLIIGLPGYEADQFEHDLAILNSLPISHISVYILSIDSNSVFQKLSEKGKFQPEDDDIMAEKYLFVSEYLKSAGFEHYEISNFAKNSKYSEHNTAYWQQKPYIGLGASAHSYDIDSRQWNIAHLISYTENLDNNKLVFEKEILTETDKYNEYLMTNLRTMWGIPLHQFREKYSAGCAKLEQKLDILVSNGLFSIEDNRIRMTEKGWLISDGIFSDLFE